jgi:hypothetical protein
MAHILVNTASKSSPAVQLLLQQSQQHGSPETLTWLVNPSDPYTVHHAVSNVALICLAKSNNTKQKEFAGQL